MALFTRSRLARGVKLARQRVFDLLSSVASQIGALTVGRENLAEPNAPFWVHLHVPQLDRRFFGRSSVAVVPGEVTLPIPFCLPPLQQFWDTTQLGHTSQTTPRVVLDAITFSFDQRAEAAVVVNDTVAAGVDEGKLNFASTNGVDLLQVRLALLEKTARFFGGTAPWTPEREVFSVSLPPEVFLSNTFKSGNPFRLGDLNKVLDPYKTYVLALSFPNWTTSHNVTIPALHFGLRFKHPVVAMVVDDGTILPQNMPVDVATRTGRVVTITTPVNDQHVSAEQPAGLHTNMQTLDVLLRNRLEGGWAQDGGALGNAPHVEDLQGNSGYHVIAVPMWTNLGLNQSFTAASPADAPYVGPAPYTAVTVDRRLVELDFPFVLHHVLAGLNHCRPFGASGVAGAPAVVGRHPTSPTLTNEVGVALLTGVRSEHWAYQLLAFDSWTVATKAARNVDRVKFVESGTELSESATEPWDVELLHVPLVRRAGAGQAGRNWFNTGGWPVYCGRGTNTTSGVAAADRTTMGADTAGGATAASLTRGAEQMLEVRWSIRDTVGLSAVTALPPGAAASVDETYAGVGGHWVFLVGQCPLVRATGDVPV